MKKEIFAGMVSILFIVGIAAAGQPAGKGFDDAGYNRQARIFVGTGESWCMDKIGDRDYCDTYYGPWLNDKLIMKWNAEWDRGNADGWDDPPYDAWLSNHWNGQCKDCSGEVWQYKIKWTSDPDNSQYPIWGQFEVVMSHGTYPEDGHPVHFWETHETPTGYGA